VNEGFSAGGKRTGGKKLENRAAIQFNAIKGIFHPKIKMLSSFINPHVVSNPSNLFCQCKTKGK